MQKFSTVAGLIIATALVSACSEKKTPLPQGLQTVRGVVTEAELSMVRRGTHLLVVEGKPKYYLESRTIDLGEFVGSTVTFKGTLEENTDPDDHPVLVVQESLEQEDAFRLWNIDPLQITIELPSRWRGNLTPTGAIFSGGTLPFPILTIEGHTIEEVPFQLVSTGGNGLPTTPIVVASKRGFWIIDQKKQTQEIHIDRGVGTKADQKRVITLRFQSDARDEQEQNEQIRSALRSIHFITEKERRATSREADPKEKSSTGASSASAVSERLPCGGPAGILCSSGQYCDVSDLQSNIGTCKARGGQAPAP